MHLRAVSQTASSHDFWTSRQHTLEEMTQQLQVYQPEPSMVQKAYNCNLQIKQLQDSLKKQSVLETYIKA